MSTQEATIRNTDLWTKYFQDEWSRWWNPLGAADGGAPVAQVAEGTAARVAGFLTLVAAGPIAWMYNANQIEEIRPAAGEAELEPVEEPAA